MWNDDSERKCGGGVLNTTSSLIKTCAVTNELMFEGTSRNTRRYTRVTSWSHLTVCWKLVSNLAMELAWHGWNQTGKGHSHENNGGQLGGGRHTTAIWPILVNYSNFYKDQNDILSQLEDTNRTSAVTSAHFNTVAAVCQVVLLLSELTVWPAGSLKGGHTMWKRGMATWKTSSLFAGREISCSLA